MSRPYSVTVWRGRYIELGRFETFAPALACYSVNVSDHTVQLVNKDRADDGRDGLTDEERDQVAAISYAEEQAASKAVA